MNAYDTFKTFGEVLHQRVSSSLLPSNFYDEGETKNVTKQITVSHDSKGDENDVKETL
jgi:hypothetical protein